MSAFFTELPSDALVGCPQEGFSCPPLCPFGDVPKNGNNIAYFHLFVTEYSFSVKPLSEINRMINSLKICFTLYAIYYTIFMLDSLCTLCSIGD